MRYKRYIKVLVFLACILLTASVCLATQMPAESWGEQPFAMSGPFPLDRAEWIPDGFTVAQTQVIPEGCLGYGYETFLALANPTDSKARVIVILMGRYSYYQTNPLDLLPHQRRTWNIGDTLKWSLDHFRDYPDLSVKVLSDTEHVYAQESMYWNNRTAGHTSCGFTY